MLRHLRHRPPRPRRARQGGFTLLELLIAMLVLIIGLVGIMMLVKNSVGMSGYTRHVTEATVLGEDKMEVLRTTMLATIADGTEQVNHLGYADTEGLYTRTWTHLVNADGTVDLEVVVSWDEGDSPKQVVLRTIR